MSIRTKLHKILKKAGADFSLTMLASILTVGILELFVYPGIAASIDVEAYGIFLTVIGVVNALGPSFGSSLRNSRIVLHEEYSAVDQKQSDFAVLLYCTLPFLLAITIAISLLLFNLNSLNSVLVGITVVANVATAYYDYVYRLPIDPKGYLKRSCCTCIGYLAGIPIVAFSKLWIAPFLLAALLPLFYIHKTTTVIQERPAITSLMKKALASYGFLTSGNLLSYASTYIDRFLLLPLLGSQSVSIYYAASFCGKAFNFFAGPLSTVLLSYISDGTVRLDARRYNLINVALLVFGVLALLLLLLIAPPITSILYPKLYEQALPYMLVGNAASLVMVLNSINGTIILKVAPAYWQTIRTIFRLALTVCSIAPIMMGGALFEFSVALLIANGTVFFVSYIIGNYYIRKKPDAIEAA